MIGVWALWACDATRCGPEECAEVCATPPTPSAPVEPGGPPPAPAPSMSAFEHSLIDPMVADVRAGVRPWGDGAVGICRGKKDCEAFLGADAGELPPGDYFVKAELRVPAAGEKGTWTVKFETECQQFRPGATEPDVKTYDRTYEVWYAGPDRGYRLQPLRAIESPTKGGATRCTYTLTAPHPDGDKVMTGSWSTP